MDSVGYTALSGLGIVVVNQIANLATKWYQKKSVEQKRQWDLEDQDRKNARLARDLAAHTSQETEKVLGQIAETRALNEDQINVSNGYNLKIAANAAEIALLHSRMDSLPATFARDPEFQQVIRHEVANALHKLQAQKDLAENGAA